MGTGNVAGTLVSMLEGGIAPGNSLFLRLKTKQNKTAVWTRQLHWCFYSRGRSQSPCEERVTSSRLRSRLCKSFGSIFLRNNKILLNLFLCKRSLLLWRFSVTNQTFVLTDTLKKIWRLRLSLYSELASIRNKFFLECPLLWTLAIHFSIAVETSPKSAGFFWAICKDLQWELRLPSS